MRNIAISVYRSTDNMIAYESHNKRYFKTLSARVTKLSTAQEKAFLFITQLNDECIVGFMIYYTDATGARCMQLNKLENTNHIKFMGDTDCTEHI